MAWHGQGVFVFSIKRLLNIAKISHGDCCSSTPSPERHRITLSGFKNWYLRCFYIWRGVVVALSLPLGDVRNTEMMLRMCLTEYNNMILHQLSQPEKLQHWVKPPGGEELWFPLWRWGEERAGSDQSRLVSTAELAWRPGPGSRIMRSSVLPFPSEIISNSGGRVYLPWRASIQLRKIIKYI